MAELFLVEFKGSRKEYYYNTYYHSLTPNDVVVVQAERGEDIGVLLVKVPKEPAFDERQKPRSILRRASNDERRTWQELRLRELQVRSEVIGLIAAHNLQMKVVDVYYQFDGNKMTIYFTADRRVDFRDLVKDLAARYRTRIELRQIGVRDEARRLDGYGICGLRQCCNTFIQEFAPVSTQQAREQDLPLNPAKISGNCGRLLCCLQYEVDLYSNCKRRFPAVGTQVTSALGQGVIERIDVFKDEAVVRTEESTYFRVPAKEFAAPGMPTPPPPPLAVTPADEELTRALADEDLDAEPSGSFEEPTTDVEADAEANAEADGDTDTDTDTDAEEFNDTEPDSAPPDEDRTDTPM